MKMKTVKKFTAATLLIALTCFTITGCATQNNVTPTLEEKKTEQIETTVPKIDLATTTESEVINLNALGIYTEKDLDASWDKTSSTQIALSGTHATIDGSGASISDSIITINAAGDYLISGTMDDGQIIVDASENDDVHLILNGASIKNTTTSPIYVKRADKVIITLADGTENAIEDGATYLFENGLDEPNAALFSNADLTLNGEGSLAITASYNNGIGTKDDLVIISGTITIDAKNDALRGRDSITIQNGTFNLVAGGDALQSNNDTDDAKGFILIDGGIYTLQSGDDALHAQSNLTITDGLFSVVAIDDAFHAEKDLTISGGTLDIVDSYEGLEASNILVSGGDISLNSSDDGINAAGETGGNYEYIQTGGTVYMNAEGDGLDANGSFRIDGGSLIIDGPVMSMNGPLDYDGSGIVTGGMLIAAGSSGMAQTPGSESTQNALMIYFTNAQKTNTEIRLVDASGTTVASHTPAKEFQTIVFSSKALTLNETYTLYSDGVELANVTLSDKIMTVSDTGETIPGEFVGVGGMRPMPGGKNPTKRP